MDSAIITKKATHYTDTLIYRISGDQISSRFAENTKWGKPSPVVMTDDTISFCEFGACIPYKDDDGTVRTDSRTQISRTDGKLTQSGSVTSSPDPVNNLRTTRTGTCEKYVEERKF